jgi:CubicO group peptidase (beta-lactamase class C family)
VGSSFLLIRENGPALRQFHGYSNVANKTPIDWNTCYHWASITKTFTAIAIMQLRDWGRLRLDDSVSSYVPELRQVHNPYGRRVHHHSSPADAQRRISQPNLALAYRVVAAF